MLLLVISDRIRKIVFTDHDNQQFGKATGDNTMWSSVSTKDVGWPYKLIGVVEEINKHIWKHVDLHHHASNLTYLRHARKISDCSLASVGHAQGLSPR